MAEIAVYETLRTFVGFTRNYFSGRVSGLRADPSTSRPCPPRRPRHHAVPHCRTRGAYPGLPGGACGPHLVQLVPPSVVSAVRLPPDRALARAPAGAVAGL